MTKKNTSLSKKQFFDLLPLFVMIICTAVVVVFCRPGERMYDSSASYLQNGWSGADDKEYFIDDLPPGDVVLTHSIENIDKDRKQLCFVSTDTVFSVYFDGELNYTYKPELAPILGRSYGRYIHMIKIPENAASVTLDLHPVYKGKSAGIRDICIEDSGLFMGYIYHKGLPNYSLSMLIALFGMLMLAIGFFSLHSGASDKVDFFSLGVFAILVGIWSSNETLIFQVYTQRPEIIRFLIYQCLIFVAYPAVSFIASVTGNRDTRFIPVIKLLTFADFVLNIVLSLFGICDIKMLLPIAHVNIAVAMLMMIYLMARAVHNNTIDPEFLHMVITGMSSVMIGAALDLLRFKLVPESPLGTSLFTKIGVLIFIVFMGIYLMRERTRIAVDISRAELMTKLAYTDGLTGLENRASFHEKEDEIRRESIECTIVQLDINNLKKVNDVYGHSEGDRQIIEAANIIRESFEDIGTAYRTGGDEFIVVVESSDGSKETEEALKHMEDCIEKYNSDERPPIPLQLAYGFASFDSDSEALESAEQLADRRMYEKKREMKALD